MSGKVSIGLLGLGTVGKGVVKVLKKFDNIEIKKIAVKNIDKKREIADLDQSILTNDAYSVVDDPEIKILVEVVGGVNPCLDLIKRAIQNKKHIVTANKELIAKHGEELFKLARKHNVVILYEAAVAGGIPIIMPLKQSLAANKITKIAGILNGTTNYILSRMETEGSEFETILKDAQRLGYAEADPSGDIQGYDAAYKIAILSSLAFNKRININEIYREGIDRINPVDIAYASEFGYKIKLIALAQAENNDKVDIRVHPMLVPKIHPLANINQVLNAVVVESDIVGQVMFAGPGAGELPTASSVVGDILAITSELDRTDYILPMMRCKHELDAQHLKIDETMNKYYIRVNASNIPGVIGDLGIICGKNQINLYSIIQKGILEDGSARIVLLTESAYEKNIQKAVEEISKRPTTKKIANVIRVMD
ncbi:MAG: homoserine dehydrogenase [bacterium]